MEIITPREWPLCGGRIESMRKHQESGLLPWSAPPDEGPRAWGGGAKGGSRAGAPDCHPVGESVYCGERGLPRERVTAPLHKVSRGEGGYRYAECNPHRGPSRRGLERHHGGVDVWPTTGTICRARCGEVGAAQGERRTSGAALTLGDT